MEKSNISLTSGDFYHSVPSPTLLWRPSTSSTDSSAPDPCQPCSSCSQCMPCSCPAVQRCRVAQLSPSQLSLEPSGSSCLQQPHIPSLASPAELSVTPCSIPVLLDIPMCSQHGSWHSPSPSSLFPVPQVLVPFTRAIDPTSLWGRSPSSYVPVLRYFPNV